MSSSETARLLRQSRSELEAARLLADRGFFDQVASHAYFAAFYAAEAALLAVGQTRSKHSGVISAFGKLIVKEGEFDAAIAAALRQLFDFRHAATYDGMPVTPDAAAAGIADAERFVAAVEAWIARRSPS